MLGRIEVLIDTQTGVNYLFYARSESGGLTPLLDKEGRPVITPQGKDPE
ncbi:MAG: xylan 1,4-beta-xylosidase [Ruminococcus sp.]|nr:xylan 1,4-beta-xylosidase [Ruminococcus sp.]